MRKILSILIAGAVLLFNTVLPKAAEIEVPVGVSPVAVSGDGVTTITVDDVNKGKQFTSSNKAVRAYVVNGVQDGTLVYHKAVDLVFYVNCEETGMYTLDTMGYRDHNNFAKLSVNGEVINSQTDLGSKQANNCSLNEMNQGEIKLDEGVNTIAFTGNGNAFVRSISLTLSDTVPKIGEITSSVEKPFMGESFTITALVEDDNGISEVVCKVNDTADTIMTAIDENTYTADISLDFSGENTITITAADSAGLTASKTYTIVCADYKVGLPSITKTEDGQTLTYTGTITFFNSSQTSKQTCLVIGIYDSENTLVGFNCENAQIGLENVPLSVSVSVPAGEYQAELMLWDDLWSMNEWLAEPYKEQN